MRKGREAKAGPSPDLLLCFPSRRHWTLVPKPICSPGRPSESNNRRRHLSQSATLLCAKAKSAASDIAEPSSPKVTCAGQIKVTQSSSACGNWHSMMDDVDKIHDDGKLRKRTNWAQSFGFKREIMQFLTCLRTLRFDLHCFGSFPSRENTTDDDDDEEEQEEEGYPDNHVGIEETSDDATRAVFSKWFMMLQENQNEVFDREGTRNKDNGSDDGSIAESGVPPPTALLLTRCRSAPVKSWCEDNEEQEKEDKACAEEGKEKVEQTDMKLLMEKQSNKEKMVVMRYDYDFDRMSTDIAKEPWIVGRLRDTLSKSRSWKR